MKVDRLKLVRRRLREHARRARLLKIRGRTYEQRLRADGRQYAYDVALSLLEALK